MNSIYNDILIAKKQQKKLLAVLLDPDKLLVKDVATIVCKINDSSATHIFVGGSTVAKGETETLVIEIKKHTNLPIVLFPGNF